jgi:hypothetical protein
MGVNDVGNVRCCYLRELLTSTTPVTTISITMGQFLSVTTVVYPSVASVPFCSSELFSIYYLL